MFRPTFGACLCGALSHIKAETIANLKQIITLDLKNECDFSHLRPSLRLPGLTNFFEISIFFKIPVLNFKKFLVVFPLFYMD